MNIVFNGQPRSTPDGATVAQLLDSLQLAPRHVAVEVNLEIIPRERHADHALAEGDQVEVVTLVGGG